MRWQCCLINPLKSARSTLQPLLIGGWILQSSKPELANLDACRTSFLTMKSFPSCYSPSVSIIPLKSKNSTASTLQPLCIGGWILQSGKPSKPSRPIGMHAEPVSWPWKAFPVCAIHPRMFYLINFGPWRSGHSLECGPSHACKANYHVPKPILWSWSISHHKYVLVGKSVSFVWQEKISSSGYALNHPSVWRATLMIFILSKPVLQPWAFPGLQDGPAINHSPKN